jgi:vitamin B12 transporter
MPFIRPPHIFNSFLTALLLILCLAPSHALGEENEDTLELFSAFQESSSSASRAPKPLSQTAENITIVTAQEIEALNAHTLADVLATIPGIQTQNRGGPGSPVFTFIHSSNFNHVLVLLDGVALNNLGDNFSDVTLVPARIIERIEIVKGAASSAWGQALGGVINVITKSPEQRKVGGSATTSIGEATTADTNAELSGTVGRLGYYLFGSYLGSAGLLPGQEVNSNNAYAKLVYDLPDKGQINATFNYNRSSRGSLFVPDFQLGEKQKFSNLYATLSFNRPLSAHLQLEVEGYNIFRQSMNFESATFVDNSFTDFTEFNHDRELVNGVSAKLSRKDEHNLLVVGGNFEHVRWTTTAEIDLTNNTNARQKLSTNRWGFFLNDTFSYGRLALIPGARFDRTGDGDQFSPSFGATWQLTDSTLLRGYTARGYSLPNANSSRSAEKVWTSQIGVESSAVPYLWLKGTLFRNEIWDIGADKERRIALGSEIEVRTTPVFNTSIGAGYTFTDTTRSSDDSQVFDAPRHTVQLALRYDDHKIFRSVLTGRHIYWNSNPDFNGRYGGLIWDLHLGATLIKREQNSLELFFSGHNLFNGDQFSDDFVPNVGRWFEGGMRVRF